MKRVFLFLVFMICMTGTGTAGRAALVINEFMAANERVLRDSAGDYDDWVEVYNAGAQPVDVGGWYLTDDLSDPAKWQFPRHLPSQTTIAPHGFLLVWADDEPDEGDLHAGFKLNSKGEELGLYDADGMLIDSVVFGSQSANTSYGRIPDGGAGWQTLGTPTPCGPNRHSGVVINEIMYNPYSETLQGEDLAAEYIELFNSGSDAVNLAGWQLARAVSLTFGDVTLAGGDYLVVVADADAFAARYPEVAQVVGGWDGRLSDSGETIELRDASGALVDEVPYADSGDWGVRELGPADRGHRGWRWRNDHDGAGKSLELINPALPNEYGANWAASVEAGGTPGRLNSIASADTAPLIAGAQHRPVIPGPVDPVVVTATVVDESPFGPTVNLRYRIDRSVFADRGSYPTFDANEYVVVPMFDDGAHADGAAGDHVYGAEIPPQPDGVVVEFYIEAIDHGGQMRTWPAPSLVEDRFEQVTNALYRVDAAFNPYTYWQIGSQPLYYMVMTEMERGRLAYLGNRSDEAFSHAQMNGTFISVDGRDILLRYNVGIRNRGNGSRTPPPNNYHVNFPSDRRWKDVSAININSKYTHNQWLGHALYLAADMPALDVQRVQVRINGQDLAPLDPGRMYGSYVHLEVYDSDWADHHFPDDNQGNVYRCVSRGRYCDLRYQGADPERYSREDWYVKNSNAAVNDWSDLIALTYALDRSPDETYVEEVEKVVNVEQWMRWFAMETFLTNRETNLGNGYGDDYCMYRGVEDPRFLLLPYDLDTILNSPDPNTSIWLAGRLNNLPVVRRFLTHPAFVGRYYAQLKDLAETIFASERFNPFVENTLGGWVPQTTIESIETFVAARRRYVLSQIPVEFTAGSDLPSFAGYPVTSVPYVHGTQVRGTADAMRTQSVLVNGWPVQWSGREGQWALGRTLLDLSPGINRMIVETFDGPEGTGRPLDSGYVDIYYQTGSTNDYPRGSSLTDASSSGTSPCLNLIVRDSYLPGVPVLVRIELLAADGTVDRDVWETTATFSVSGNPTIRPSTGQCTLYNGVGSALVTFTGRGDFTLTVYVAGVERSVTLVDVSDQPVRIVSGTLRESETWSGVCCLTRGDFTIPAGVTLTLSPGTLVLIEGVSSGSDGTDIDVQGGIQSLGTAASPVTFTCLGDGQNWGELHFVDAAPSTFRYTHITRAGRSPPVGHSHSGPAIRVANSTLLFDQVALTDHAGKIMDAGAGTDLTFRRCLLARSVMGPEVTGTALRFEDGWITDMHAGDDADGIYIHDQLAGQQCRIRRSVIAGMDDDGVDTLGSEIRIEDSIIRDCRDKGVSVYGGRTTIDRCLIVANNTAPEDPTTASVAAKAYDGSSAVVDIDHTSIVTSKVPGHVDVGLQSHNKTGVTSGTIVYNVTNSIVDATVPVDVQAPYQPSDVHIRYCCLTGQTWPGEGNFSADVLFVDPQNDNYRLPATSPCIGAAAPGDPLRDLGYYQSTAALPSSPLTGEDLLWTADEGPYRVTASLIIPPDITLTIGPGTTVFFDPNVRLIVEGRLVAAGTEYETIRFTRTPERGGTWGGLQFVDSPHESLIRHAVIEYGRTHDGMVGLENSSLLMEHVTFDHTDLRRICTMDSSLVVRNCVFTDMFAPGKPPSTDNLSEHIWGRGVPATGRFILDGNVFGRTPGHNDAVDFDGATRPDAIPQILNNVFLGGGDEALDLETDAHIEGNVFMNYVEDRFNRTPRESNVISAGAGREYVVVRNVFHHVQHVAQIKDRAFMWFENNTVVDANAAVFHFEIPGQTTSPGRGVHIDSCIFRQCPTLLGSLRVNDAEWGTTDVTVDRCLLPGDWHALGEGNIDADPLFVGEEDFHLKPWSAARGTGMLGLDMGAFVPAGASVAGEPQGWTYRTQAKLTVGGPGVTHYVYSVNEPNGPWSQEYSVDTPVLLTGLKSGRSYTVYVRGKNSAGAWQNEPHASGTWTVDTAYRRLVLNEILAANETFEHEGSYPDLVELYYDGPSAVSLSGMRLSDDPRQPDRFVFPAGVTMNPGDYLVLFADTDVATSGVHLGFALDRKGGQLSLYDRDGSLIDSVEFGPQLPDLAIGRTGPAAEWRLVIPTFGFANVAQPLGDPSTVRLNEWLTEAEVLFERDFIEVHNPNDDPVDIGGFYLTDRPAVRPDRYRVPLLSFVQGHGFAVFAADGEDLPGHVGFRLSPDGEVLGLLDPNLREVDKVLFGPQTPDVSQGRAPDGSDRMDWLELPTPGMWNPVRRAPVVTRIVLVPEEADKRVIVPVSADEVSETWKSDPVFDDSTWLRSSGGPGGVGYERSTGYEDWISLDIENQMYGRNTTCYIRVPFTTATGLAGHFSELMLSVRFDDGFVAYLNGTEVARVNFTGAPQWDSEAEADHESYAQTFDAVFDISEYAGLLHDGENLLAIHGLNTPATSSDLIFSVALEATVVEGGDSEYAYREELRLLDFLRITELMYHSTAGDRLDYVELCNTGAEPLDLTGLRFTDGIQFTFDSMKLEAGQCVVVVDDLAAFQAACGTEPRIAGEYAGHLSDGGEDIVLSLPAPLEAAVMRFRYEDDWYPATDGDGRSLAIEDVTVPAAAWNRPENWYSSPPTPGRP